MESWNGSKPVGTLGKMGTRVVMAVPGAPLGDPTVCGRRGDAVDEEHEPEPCHHQQQEKARSTSRHMEHEQEGAFGFHIRDPAGALGCRNAVCRDLARDQRERTAKHLQRSEVLR